MNPPDTRAAGGRQVTVLVGTDHHPFSRAVAWADARQRSHPEETVTVQYGDSDAPVAAVGEAFMPQVELQALVARSQVVVTHGGPGTIMDVRNAGHRPVVVPRDPAFGEHVDNHQLLFGAWCDAKGLARLVTDVSSLDQVVDDLGGAGTTESPSAAHSTEETARQLVKLLEETRGRRRVVALGAPLVLALTGVVDPTLGTSGTLTAAAGVAVLGDVSRLWQDGPAASTRCSCGKSVDTCAVWRAIGEHAFGGWDALDTRHARHLQEAAIGWQIARRRMRPPVRRRLLAYTALHRQVHQAAREVTGAQLLVEAHEEPTTALVLSHDTGVDLSVLDVGRAPGGHPRSRGHDATLWALARRRVPVGRLRIGQDPADGGELRRAWRQVGLPDLLPPRGVASAGASAVGGAHTLLTSTKAGS